MKIHIYLYIYKWRIWGTPKKSRESKGSICNEGTLLFLEDTGGQFMDTTAPRIKVSPDLARESLIAISQLNPDKNLSAPKLLHGNAKNCNGVAVNESDIDEDYRSKLISISYTRSPDSEKIPTLPGNLLD
ncbi:hypothetical protein AAC387_Pa01g3122 [Persea americana]